MPVYNSQSATTTQWLGYVVNDVANGYLYVVGGVAGLIVLALVLGYAFKKGRSILGRKF